MSSNSRPPFLDFVPDFPEELTLRSALIQWLKETCHFLRHTIRPTKRFLPSPERTLQRIEPENLRLEPTEVDAYADAIRRLVEDAETRVNLVRSKGNNLLGFATLVTPIFAWWLLSGRDRLDGAPISALCSNTIGLFAACFLCLAIRALLRTQSVVGFNGPGMDMVISTEPGTLRSYDLIEELRRLVLRWGEHQRWADVIADHFRAGQRFLVIALTLSVVAGGICYFHEASPSAVVLVQGQASPTQPPSGLPSIVVTAGAFVVVSMTGALALQLYIAMRLVQSLKQGREVRTTPSTAKDDSE